MFAWLKKWLTGSGPASTKGKRPGNDWEPIGGWMMGSRKNLDKVPRWVRKAIRDVESKNTWSFLVGQEFTVRGRRYEYRFAWSGQGGDYFGVSRRKRHKK